MLVNCLTKEKIDIQYTTNDNGIIKKATNKLLFNYIWKLHDLILLLILNKGLQFISGV